jgi:MOSC domain-containing protein YiiM
VLQAGDELTVVHRPDHQVTVSTMFRAFTTDRDRMSDLLAARGALAPSVREEVERYAARAASSG